MCGICGQLNYASLEPVALRDVEAMTKTLVHRGPDDEDLHYVSGPLGLGFRRLSIIDLAGGHQPMSNEAESVWVVFNGEIYNFREPATSWPRTATSSVPSRIRKSSFTVTHSGETIFESSERYVRLGDLG